MSTNHWMKGATYMTYGAYAGTWGEKIDTVNGRQIFETEQMGRDNATTSIKLHAT